MKTISTFAMISLCVITTLRYRKSFAQQKKKSISNNFLHEETGEGLFVKI